MPPDEKKDDDETVSEQDKDSSEKTTGDDEESEKDTEASDGEEESSSEETDDADAGQTEEDEPEEEEEEDGASPEAVARRVAALGGDEDESDRIAALEEAKLAERKATRKGKRSGLQKSASKRLSKIGTKARPQREVASAIEAAEPTIQRAIRAEDWAKKNQTTVWGIVGATVLVALGWFGWAYLQHQKATAASVALAQAVADENGRIGDPAKTDDPDKPDDPGISFKTYDERRDSALAKYRDVSSKYSSTGAATLARLGEGALLLDKRETDGAIAAFTDAKDSALAKADVEVMGRTLEGLGFAYEQKAQATPAEKDKYLDLALTQFKALENTDVVGFKELGMYHQGRVFEAKGDVAKAKETLKALHDRLNEPGQNHPLPYLQELCDDRLRRLDPNAVPAKEHGALGGPTGKGLTPAQLKELFSPKTGGPK